MLDNCVNDSGKSNVISHIISLRTIDCEFAFDKYNNFCETGALETLVSENSAFKEKDVAKTTSILYLKYYVVMLILFDFTAFTPTFVVEP